MASRISSSKEAAMTWIGKFALVCAAVVALGCDTNRRNTTVDQNSPNNQSNQTTRDRGTVGTSGASASDRDFVDKAASSGMAEVELGKMALDRATSNEVKQFAQMMVRDHT